MFTNIRYEDIKPYIRDKKISMRVHPDNEDIAIFNYTTEVQLKGEWDRITSNCRGLVLNTKTGERLTNPFSKFFNYDQWLSMGGFIDIKKIPEVTEKVDGFFGILYWLNGLPYIATRGAFTSQQALWATEWLRQRPEMIKHFNKEYSYIFEIIHPVSNIVVKYKEPGLVLLAVRHLTSAHEIPLEQISDEIPKATVIKDFTDAQELKNRNIPNAEGYVLHYTDIGFRLKIKFKDYLDLHFKVVGISEVQIWEKMRDLNIVEISCEDVVEDVPDEFFSWMKEKIYLLKKDYYAVEKECLEMMEEILEQKSTLTEKQLAEKIKALKYPSIGFLILREKDYKKQIIRLIRPFGKVTALTDTKQYATI